MNASLRSSEEDYVRLGQDLCQREGRKTALQVVLLTKGLQCVNVIICLPLNADLS